MDYDSWAVTDATDQGSPRRSPGGGDDIGTPPSDDLPACQSCRKRKSKCSREIPSCSQCIRLRCECVYITKQKPGLKAGAIDGLSRRLEILERLLLDSGGNRKRHLAFLDADDDQLANQQLISILSSSRGDHHNGDDQDHAIEDDSAVEADSQREGGPRKRRRIEEIEFPDDEDDGPWVPALPSLPLLDAVVEAHFHTVHHWIPVLHETRFRAKLKDPQERKKLAVLFHALISAAIKYVNLEEFGLTVDDVERQIRISRKAVMINAMESLSVENTTALIFLAFDYLGSGQVAKAWPIIGSLTRTVDYLQLTVEPDDDSPKQPLLRSLTILEKPRDWTDSEARRRLFWVVFLLDRTCSVTSGWHTSLTSDDVRRRLPCGGGLWAREEPVSTPFFGIWDKSSAKIGNSIANAPNMYPSPRALDQPSPASTGDVDTSKIGAFAYCIEATESLSQVTSFFLQQSVDFEDRQEVKNWLTRFKELDLRLVHWKMFLPQQWQDSNVSRDVSVIKMDPNLTLAHVTHNTSMILLHQHIAYPPPSWKDVVALPSSCSAETCQLAAVEISSIVEKYLRYMGGIVNSQFAFCAFAAARVLLVHWRSDATNTLAPEFFTLLQSLQDMSSRWRGYYTPTTNPESVSSQQDALNRYKKLDLACRYATQLSDLHARCVGDAEFSRARYSGILSEASLEGFLQNNVASPSPDRQSTTSYHGYGAASVNSFQAHVPANREPLPQNHHVRSASMNSELDRRYQAVPQHEIPAAQRQPARPRPSIGGYERQGTRFTAEEVSPRAQFGGIQSPAAAVHQPAPSMMSSAASGLVPMGMDHRLAPPRPIIHEEDELTAMSQMLLENQFLEMDRVIRLDGTDFYYDTGGGAGLMS